MSAVFFSCEESGEGTDNKDKTKPQYFKVIFESNNGLEVKEQNVEKGKTVKEPDTPIKEGYFFSGWCSDIELTEMWDFNTKVDSDLTLYAKWTDVLPEKFAVTFVSNGGSAVSQQMVIFGATAISPIDPLKSGYVFDGWYSDNSLTTVFDFSETITSDVTLYAKWSPVVINHIVTFESNDGSSVLPQTVSSGGNASRPADPVKSGFTFEGWYSDRLFTTAFDFSDEITSDVTLYAKWSPEVINHIVTFESNDGSSVSPQTVSDGGNAFRPADPVKGGFTFEGWYSDRLLTTAFDFSDEITSDITLYAKWSPETNSGHTITLTYDGPNVSPRVVYVSWIEDESENVLQNIFICDRILPNLTGKDGLTGVALPFWKQNKYDVNMVDGMTGASTQVSKTVTRTLDIGTTRRFRVYFEIDRSRNGNTYFNDRPSFIYRSSIIDLDNIATEYTLSLYGYMGNGTQSGTFGQHVNVGQNVPGYGPYVFMNSLNYLEPLNDMVTQIKVIVEEN